MNKLTCAAWGLLFLACSPVLGQDWANKMFSVRQHNFGTIAHGAKAEFEFPFKNLYLEDVHVASARPSCGCTSVRFKDDRQWLKTYETGALVASINSGSFLGNRGATITVTFDKPYWAEAQLHVSVVIRSDVLLSPGSVQFGSVNQGAAAEKQVDITFPGGNNLRILGVRSTSQHVVPKLFQASQGWGRTAYQLRVYLNADTPPGYLNDQLTLVTNDPQSPQLPLLVEGRVVPGIVVSPSWLSMGVVQPGQKVNRQMVIQGREPFIIQKITSDGDDLQFDLPAQQDPKQVQVVPVTFLAGDSPGKVTRTIRIETDRSGMVAELSAQAVVAESETALAQRTGPTAPPPSEDRKDGRR